MKPTTILRACELCGSVKSLNALVRDHNHTTGMRRGFLCYGCNVRVGSYENNLREKGDGRTLNECEHLLGPIPGVEEYLERYKDSDVPYQRRKRGRVWVDF